jgi:hypothetical protein
MSANAALVAVELLAASVWVGSLASLAVVARVARRALDPPSRVTFFRALGRHYALVGPGSLSVSIGVGLAIVWPPSQWSGFLASAVGLVGALVVATVAGMAQARSMTQRRQRAVSAPGDSAAAQAVRQGRWVAGGLRGLMAALTVAIVVLSAEAISH